MDPVKLGGEDMLSEGEKLEWSEEVGHALVEVFNRPTERTVKESMEILGLGLHYYFWRLFIALENEKEE